MTRKTVLATLLIALVAPASASAVSATVTVSQTSKSATVNAVVKRAAARPSKVSVTFGTTVIKLSRVSGSAQSSTWKSAAITGGRRNTIVAAIATRVAVKLTIKGKARTVQAKAKEVGAAKLPGTETPAEPTPTTPTPTGPTAPTSLFGTPAAALVGQPAAEAVVPFLLDARFTDCVAGWPNCAVEHRYSQFASGDHYYCRLTSTSGADINSYANNLTVTGANQATDGSWAVSYAVLSYGNVVNYRWDVTPLGAATGQYWGPSVPTSGPPSDVLTGYQWVRGAKDCSY